MSAENPLIEACMQRYREKQRQEAIDRIEEYIEKCEAVILEYRKAFRRIADSCSTVNRWPCHECGRPGPDAPLRINNVTTEDGVHMMVGCRQCNEVGRAVELCKDMLNEEET